MTETTDLVEEIRRELSDIAATPVSGWSVTDLDDPDVPGGGGNARPAANVRPQPKAASSSPAR